MTLHPRRKASGAEAPLKPRSPARAAVFGAAFAALTALLLLLPSSCSKREYRAALFLYTDTDPFMNSYADELEAITGEGLSLERYSARNSQTIQNEQIETALSRRPDILLVNPVDRLGMYPVIERLMEEKVPVIFFNREPLKRDLELFDRAWYVGAKAEQSGQLQAALIARFFGPPGSLSPLDRNGDGRLQTVVLKGEQAHQDAEIRTDQVLRSLESQGYRVDILTTETANWNEEQGYRKMAGIVEDYPGEIELVVSNNDAMALGAIRSLREAGKFLDDSGNGKLGSEDSSWIPVFGIDGLKDARDMIERGFLAGTVYNDYRAQAAAVIALARTVLGLALPGEGATSLGSKYVWIDYAAVGPE